MKMGCAPSRPTSSIRVEQRQAVDAEEGWRSSEEGWRTPDNNWLDNDATSDMFQIQDDASSDSFLQESMKSHTSHFSTNSSGSWDSGVYELDDEYSYVITENSDPEKVRLVDSEFVPKDGLELILEGKACPRKLSCRDRDRLEQQAILEVLRDEGLIVRPPARAGGGLKFEVVSAEQFPSSDSRFHRRLPPLLIPEKKKETELTYEQIQKKLTEAEERRKIKNQEKLSKLATKDLQERQAVAEQQAEKIREMSDKKIQEKTKSREQRLNDVQERLKAREEHAKQVRKRKEMMSNGFNYVIPNQTE